MMRVSSVLAFVVVACAVVPVRAAEPTPAEQNVSVNLDALPIPMPRPKPAAVEMRPLAQARPRPKPATDAAVMSTAVVATPMAPIPDTPMPRWKPAIEGEAVQTALAPAVEAPATLKATAAPPTQPTLPVSLVKPTTDETFPVEITGIPQDPNASRAPIDPTAGFAVMSRVRFPKGASDIPPTAHPALNELALRLTASNIRVRLAGFSGKSGGDTSEARRLSLARALAIRNYLVSKGVPVERVDVLAFGGAPKGATDRVDVLARGI